MNIKWEKIWHLLWGQLMSNKISPDELRSRERNSTLLLPKEESTSNYMSSEYMYLLN